MTTATPPTTPMFTPGHEPWVMTVPQRLYVWLTAFFVACLLIADIVGIKLFHIPLPFKLFGYDAIEHTCGMITFPVTFLLTDLINEYYGSKGARRVTYIGLAMAAFVFIIMNLAQAMPYLDAPFNIKQESFDAVFGSAKLMYVASMSAYLVGQLADIWVFKAIKRSTGGKLLWLRATGSTIISQMLDSFVVSYIAFGIGKTLTGQPGASIPEVLKIAATGYTLKFVLAVCITPLIYLGRGILHRWFGLVPAPPGS